MPEPLLSAAEERRGIALARRQPSSAEDLAALVDRVGARVTEFVQEDEQVRGRLGEGRVRLVGADYDEDKPDSEGRPSRLARVHFFDYDRGAAVVVTVDLGRGEVVGIDERRGVHLRPSAEEVAEAYELVLRSEIGRLVEGREVSIVAFPGRSVEEDDPAWTHRRIELHLWSADRFPERLASAVADLTDGRVLPYDEDREG
jgi:hypothetical protein